MVVLFGLCFTTNKRRRCYILFIVTAFIVHDLLVNLGIIVLRLAVSIKMYKYYGNINTVNTNNTVLCMLQIISGSHTSYLYQVNIHRPQLFIKVLIFKITVILYSVHILKHQEYTYWAEEFVKWGAKDFVHWKVRATFVCFAQQYLCFG